MTQLKIAAVSYLNTVPFIYGIECSGHLDAELLLAPPSQNVRTFTQGEADMALVPVGALRDITDYRIITSYCIGASDKVRSVVITGNSPVENTKRLWLDSHSRTSVLLAKILCSELWHCSPEYLHLDDYSKLHNPQDGDSFLLIGDKVFANEGKFSYSYDVAENWINLTAKPFVFAVWISRENVSDEQVGEFEKSLHYGVTHIPEAIAHYRQRYKPYSEHYLTNNIDYILDDKKREAMELFLSKAELVTERVPININQ